METKTFGDKKITIRRLVKGDLKNAKKFQDFINSLVEEGAKILMNKKNSFKEEQNWLKGKIENVKRHKEVFLMAEALNTRCGNWEDIKKVIKEKYPRLLSLYDDLDKNYWTQVEKEMKALSKKFGIPLKGFYYH